MFTQLSLLALAVFLPLARCKGAVYFEQHDTINNLCPTPCIISGPDPVNWTSYHDLAVLERCSSPVLFDLAIHLNVGNPDTQLFFRACMATAPGSVTRKTPGNSTGSISPLAASRNLSRKTVARFENTTTSIPSGSGRTGDISPRACGRPGSEPEHTEATFNLQWTGAGSSSSMDEIAMVMAVLDDYLHNQPNCRSSIMFANVGSTIAGLYVGSLLDKQTSASIIQNAIISQKQSIGSPAKIAGQICKAGDHGITPSSYIFGVVADFSGNISAIQSVVSDWDNGKCFTGDAHDSRTTNVSLAIHPPVFISGDLSSDNTTLSPTQTVPALRSRQVVRDCVVVKAEGGDGCFSLAQKCSALTGHTVSEKDFAGFNPQDNSDSLCNPGNIKLGLHYCCSRGKLPTFEPKPNDDGTCATYEVQTDDNCWKIANAYSLYERDTLEKMISQMEALNRQTWGFSGCPNIQPGLRMCIGPGLPPMPAPSPTATCG
jgi:hypothetical protein